MWREDLDDDAPVRPPEPPDALTQATGAGWYATRWTVNECRQGRAGSTTTGFPERFDRFYPHAAGGPLLVDVLVGDQDMRSEQRRSKHVAFKLDWCAENGRRYLALSEGDSIDVERCRALIAALSEPTVPDAQPEPAKRQPASRPSRGGVHRPKTAASAG